MWDAAGVAVAHREALFYRLTIGGLVDRLERRYVVGMAVLGVKLGGGDAVHEERPGDLGARGDPEAR